jgi:hypothetical protein
MNPRNILYLILSLVVFAALTLSSCRKSCQDPTNPKCENYDPCYKLKPTSAGFKTYDPMMFAQSQKELGLVWDVVSDTIGSNCYFVADEENAKYTWLIGAGVYHTRTVSIDFINSRIDAGTLIPVTLIVEKEPNKKCFPNDDGRDTFTKQILVARYALNKYFPMEPEDDDSLVFQSLNHSNWTFTLKSILVDTTRFFFRGRFWDNIPQGFQLDYPNSQVKFTRWNAKINYQQFRDFSYTPSKSITIITYYLDGINYDFRVIKSYYNYDIMKSITESDMKFRARRIK